MIDALPDDVSLLEKVKLIASSNPEDHRDLQYLDPLYWALAINLVFGGVKFDILNHEYEIDYVREVHPNEVLKCSPQMMKTIGQIIKRMHHLIYGYYPQGVMYIFPTDKLVQRFSQSRFTPLLIDNPILRKYIGNTDNMSLKRVGKANLYFVGARVTQKIAGEQKSSASLKSEPVDCIVEDEYDEIDQDMSALAQARMDHSHIKHRARISTPTIPGYGIDRAYNDESDQQVWMIYCSHCHSFTCLEQEFPDCLRTLKDGTVYRACKHCGREIHPRDGHWVPMVPSRSEECRGRWISQLNSTFTEPKTILAEFRDPPNGDIGLVYNRRLGMAYLAAENQLVPTDLWPLLSRDLPQMVNHPGPSAMGVDIGTRMNVVIMDKPNDQSRRVVKTVRITDFEDLHRLIVDFHVKSAVIDLYPEQRKVRDFIEAEKGLEIFACVYSEEKRGVTDWNANANVVTVNRTEICDAVHDLVITRGRLTLPRRSAEIEEEFIPNLCSLAKILSDDDETGVRKYHYIKRGPDHYYHAMNYAYLASQRVGVYVPKEVTKLRKDAYSEGDKTPGSWLGV